MEKYNSIQEKQNTLNRHKRAEQWDNIKEFLATLPLFLHEVLHRYESLDSLQEVVLDIGRNAEIRFYGSSYVITSHVCTVEDINYVISRISGFGDDNRAGIEKTLHRFSVIRNRSGNPIGITCRVGRSIKGSLRLIEDLTNIECSYLILGKPGSGKTTMLREFARILSDERNKRVLIVDTSNEIAGDGDIPHPAIGRSRRMQVQNTNLQHKVMLEAVENHTPEVIIIDEISTVEETLAARTIAERGVQLLATAHGNNLENLVVNPVLNDLVGGIHSVTLGDDEARRRKTQKTVQERVHEPTFETVIEILKHDKLQIHRQVVDSVESILKNSPFAVDVRNINPDGTISRKVEMTTVKDLSTTKTMHTIFGEEAGTKSNSERQNDDTTNERNERRKIKIMSHGVTRDHIEEAALKLNMKIGLAKTFDEANVIITTKKLHRNQYRGLNNKTNTQNRLKVLVVKSNNFQQVFQQMMRLADEFTIQRYFEK